MRFWLTEQRHYEHEMANIRGKNLSQKGEHHWVDSPRAAPLRPFKVNLSVSPPTGALLVDKSIAAGLWDLQREHL
jgi:hypothetical protein